MSGTAVADRDRGEHEPRSQGFCRGIDRFGVTYGISVRQNGVDMQFR